MEDKVHGSIDGDRLSCVLLDKLESPDGGEIVYFICFSTNQVIDTDHLVALTQQPLDQVRTDKSAPPSTTILTINTPEYSANSTVASHHAI